MYALLIAAVLTGPLPEAKPSLALRIHLSNSRESDVIRQELACDHEWFLSRRLAVERHYRIVLIEDLYRSRPCYQIGTGDDRHEFPPGSFAASGSAMRTIQSLCAVDHWHRAFPEYRYRMFADGSYGAQRADGDKPEVFPPQVAVAEIVPPPKLLPAPDVIHDPEFEPPVDVP